MEDYKDILTRPIPWINGEGEQKIFTKVRYVFSDVEVVKKWIPDLERLIPNDNNRETEPEPEEE